MGTVTNYCNRFVMIVYGSVIEGGGGWKMIQRSFIYGDLRICLYLRNMFFFYIQITLQITTTGSSNNVGNRYLFGFRLVS